MKFPPCKIWPTSPPRKNLYAEDAMLGHPLVSPLAAKSWEGSCPLYIETGTELLTDEDRHLATKAASQNVTVVFEEFEAMPHCFAMLLEDLGGARKFFTNWASFISQVTKNPGTVTTKGTKIKARSLEEIELDVQGLSTFTDEEVKARMMERVQKMTMKRLDSVSKL
jgi:hypothetical protein